MCVDDRGRRLDRSSSIVCGHAGGMCSRLYKVSGCLDVVSRLVSSRFVSSWLVSCLLGFYIFQKSYI